jgi:hypothetical protein
MRISKNRVLAGLRTLLAFGTLAVLFMFRPSDLHAEAGRRTMKVVRIYTGPDNKSHFEDLKVPLKDGGRVGSISDSSKTTGVIFRETDADYNYVFHTASQRQYVVNLEGGVEIEVGDGTKRILGTGDILLAEDTTWQGHTAAR